MIVVRDVWKSFGNNVVLKGINLEVKRGETLVIVGESGCGKSVLMRIIMGLEEADSGFVEIYGKKITTLHRDDRFSILKKMGMLFQNAALFDSMTVKENVALYLKLHKFYGNIDISDDEIENVVFNAIKTVGLENAMDMMPSNISGGMRRRVGLARLISHKPEIILYDEPTTGLDPIKSSHIDEIIIAMKKQLNATSIVITHDLNSALKIADKIALHHEGCIAYIDSRDNFFNSENAKIREFFSCAFEGKRNIGKIDDEKF